MNTFSNQNRWALSAKSLTIVVVLLKWEVKFRDLFSKSESQEKEKSAGTSVSVSVEASQSIEGIAEFKETLETEAHAEITESEGSETTREEEGEEGSSVPPWARGCGSLKHENELTEKLTSLLKGNSIIKLLWADITMEDLSLYVVHIGILLINFCDVVTGHAPDNWDLAKSFKDHGAYHADMWALDPLNSELRYTVKFEGRIVRNYTVEEFLMEAYDLKVTWKTFTVGSNSDNDKFLWARGMAESSSLQIQ